jgi:hypothetical protein
VADPWIMSNRGRVVRLWVILAALSTVMAVSMWTPLRLAWSCYWLHANGERAEAELIERLENHTLLLRFATGSQIGQACTAGTSKAIYDAAQSGQSFEVVYFEERPGDCVLSSTVEKSGLLLWSLTVAIGSVLLLIVGIGFWLQRSYTTPRAPQRRMDADPGAVRCPSCASQMLEGYLPLLAGIHWRSLGEAIGVPHALSGLPGTVGRLARPRLHAFRCASCEIISFQYGEAGGSRR